jgi:hypothetical protein
MPDKRICFVFALWTCTAFAQLKDQTFYFKYADSKDLNQYANAIKTVGDIQSVTADDANKAITVQGTDDQISLAAWLAHELNQPPTARQTQFRHDYPGVVPQSQQVHIYYLAHVDTPQALTEAVNLARSVAEVQRAMPCVALGAIALRATPAETEVANWILEGLDRPAGTMKPGFQNHPGPADSRPSTVQIYVLTNTDTPQGVQELINGTRSISDIQRFFPYNSRKALVLRGSNDEIALADWVLGLLDKPAGTAADTAAHEYRFSEYPRDTANIARVFYLNHVENPYQLMQIVDEVRTATQTPRTFPNNQAKAITMRGTGDQIARAEQMLKDK